MSFEPLHPLERSELTVETLFEDLASARRERLRSWASQLDQDAALQRGSFVLAQAAAALEQVASLSGLPGVDPAELESFAAQMTRLSARLEQTAAEAGLDAAA